MARTRVMLVALVLGITVVGAVVLGGCAPAGDTDPAKLPGQWVLEQFATDQGMEYVDPRVPSVITFIGSEEATGYGGVNPFKTTYAAKDGGKLTFGEINVRETGGAEKAINQEVAFIGDLAKTKLFAIREGKLYLLDLSNNTLAIMNKK